jgi:hypothetical protein
MVAIITDLATDPAARRARKRPVEVGVAFARSAGALMTREGEVRFHAGDALVEGAAGDRWPVPRATFTETYEALPPTAMGDDGRYRKRVVEVWARLLDTPLAVPLSEGRGTLAGAPGDWLVQYAPGDLAVVGASIFPSTYELVDSR